MKDIQANITQDVPVSEIEGLLHSNDDSVVANFVKQIISCYLYDPTKLSH